MFGIQPFQRPFAHIGVLAARILPDKRLDLKAAVRPQRDLLRRLCIFLFPLFDAVSPCADKYFPKRRFVLECQRVGRRAFGLWLFHRRLYGNRL